MRGTVVAGVTSAQLGQEVPFAFSMINHSATASADIAFTFSVTNGTADGSDYVCPLIATHFNIDPRHPGMRARRARCWKNRFGCDLGDADGDGHPHRESLRAKPDRRRRFCCGKQLSNAAAEDPVGRRVSAGLSGSVRGYRDS